MTNDRFEVLAVVLAAGQGTRLRSALPKVLHPVAGRPMLEWVLATARESGCARTAVIVGHGAERVRSSFESEAVDWVLQEEQRGTGHALQQAQSVAQQADLVLVLSGDVPLVTPRTLSRLIAAAQRGWGAMAVADVDAPGSLGRVLAASDGTLERIVEAADAAPDELAVRTVNAGIYALPAPDIFGFLGDLRPDNAKGELYLTDALNQAAAEGHAIELVELEDPDESMGVNTRHDLGQVHRALLRRHARTLMQGGVTILDHDRTVIEPSVEVGPDSVIHPGVTLLGSTSIGSGVEIHHGTWMRDTIVADGCQIHPYSVLEDARVGTDGQVGPFARLRPGAVIGATSKVGNFVEIKNSKLGEGVKANHLSYLGDAEIGARSNVGAGVITCNYDGFEKHRSVIGQDSFLGSDTMLIAPVEVGDGSMTAAGSVVSKDVPSGALAVARAPQKNLVDWMRRFRRRKGR